jgi:hypothetical protein
MIIDLRFTRCWKFALIAYSASQRYENEEEKTNNDDEWNRYISHRYTTVVYVRLIEKKKKMPCKAKLFFWQMLLTINHWEQDWHVFDMVTFCSYISLTSSLQMQRATVASDYTHWQTNTHTLGRIALDELSAIIKGLYLCKSQHTQNTNTHVAEGFEPAVSANFAAADRRLRRRGHRDRQDFYWSGAR